MGSDIPISECDVKYLRRRQHAAGAKNSGKFTRDEIYRQGAIC